MRQELRFCTASDGVRIAYATHGSGPPLVKAANWLTHLEFDWESPVWRHWLERLGQGHTLIRYDERGCGLSDREVGDLSLERWVADLEAVVDAAGPERFPLLGISQGAALAIAYACRHPERVTKLVIYGGYARGRGRRGPAERRKFEALQSAVRAGWDEPHPTFRRLFTMHFLPEGTPEQMAWYDELQRQSTSADTAARLFQARGEIDVTELAPQVTAPTLILHAREDQVVPFEEGRLLATLMSAARLVPLDSPNHILLPDEAAWTTLLSELRGFLGTDAPPQQEMTGELSSRELDVLALVAQGLSNDQIAERLVLSVRTVERHLSNVYAKLRLSGKAARAAAAARFSQLSG